MVANVLRYAYIIKLGIVLAPIIERRKKRKCVHGHGTRCRDAQETISLSLMRSFDRCSGKKGR